MLLGSGMNRSLHLGKFIPGSSVQEPVRGFLADAERLIDGMAVDQLPRGILGRTGPAVILDRPGLDLASTSVNIVEQALILARPRDPDRGIKRVRVPVSHLADREPGAPLLE